MRRLGIYLLAAATVLSPVSAWSQDLIFSSDDDDDELLDGAAFNFEDVVERLGKLQEGSLEFSGDANGDGSVNLVDPIYLLNWIFRQGPEPVPLSCSLPAGEVVDGPYPFVRVGIRLEFNETDGTAEVALAAGSNEGLRSLTVHDPSNRKIADLRSPEGRELGLEEILLESTDSTLDGVKKAYPEGAYLFQAITVSGTHLAGEAELTHDLPAAPGFVHRLSEKSLTIYWSPSEATSTYSLEIDQDDLGFHLRVKLDPTTGSYAVPVGFLVAGEEYDVSLAVVADRGNVIATESEIAIPSVSSLVGTDD